MAITKLIQVTNISPAISEEQMLTLFGFVGKIEAMCMYPSLQGLECAPNTPKICYIKFFDATCVGVSQYLTNTVFNDRALVVTPVEDGQIPDEEKAKEMAAQVGLPSAATKLPDKPKSEIINFLEGTPPNQVIVSHDPRLEEMGLPKYPPLPASFEGTVIEEIRRTVLIIDISVEVTSEELVQCFEKAGDIKYMKFCSRSDDIRYALIEFTEQHHVIEALKMNGLKFKGKVMKVYHSTQAITKPETKSNEVAQREVVEALTRVKEAESLISAAIDPLLSLGKSKRGRSRSKSPRRSRRRSRSRSRRRSRSTSHSRWRRASPRARRSRSKSHHRKLKSKSPRRHRKSHSKSPVRAQRKTRSRSPRAKKKSRSKSPRTKRKSRSKSPRRSKRLSRSKSPARAKKRSRTKSPTKLKRKSRSRSPRSKRRSRTRSPKSKLRPSPKSKAKSNLNREKSKNADKLQEKRTKGESDKKEREKDRDRDRDKRNTKGDKKDGDNRARKYEKGQDHRKSKHKDLKSHIGGKENGNYSSCIEGASSDLSHSDKGDLVKENGALESCESSVRIENDHNSEITTSFNQTDTYNKNMHSLGMVDNLDIGNTEGSVSVLKGPNNDFKPVGLDGKEDGSAFLASLQCDYLAVNTSPKQSAECYDENDCPVDMSEGSRSRSHTHSPSESVSSHCLPNIADCDIQSCSPVEPSESLV